ncbi:MAG: ketoacyl-ACP synthase III [Vicingaceae bacterium]
MGYTTIQNVAIKGISTVVPKKVVSNRNSNLFKTEKEANKFITVSGIEERRHVEENVCTSDLCFEACELLINKLNWNKDDIEILIMVTQTPDYIIPNMAIIMQDRLNLPTSTVCFDLSLGCSGYVYGLSVISNFLSMGNFSKGILLVGETLSKQCSPLDKVTFPLFGDAGTATALQHEKGNKMQFNLWSDGSGHKSLYIPDGGYRNRFNQNSLKLIEDAIGNKRTSLDTYMDGNEVFSFGIKRVPKEVLDFFKYFEIKPEKIDFCIFHQANKFMNEMIRKKVGFKKDQALYSLEKYGNTGSATIPLTISHINLESDDLKLFLCGFGIGLSIGMVYIEAKNKFINIFNEYD